jgi:DNA-binding IscR family transcriptional regulator
MEHLETQVKDIEEDSLDPDDVTPLSQIIQAIDDELDSIEKRRARLLYIRNLALEATHSALEEMDRRKKQLVHHIVDQGPTSVEMLSRTFDLREDVIRDVVTELQKEGLVRKENNMIYLRDLV